MKAFIRESAAWLLRLSPLTITAIALCLVLPLAVLDYVIPQQISFTLLYLLVVVFAGWGAGKRSVVFISGVVVTASFAADWLLPHLIPRIGWITLWNYLTHFIVFCLVGWLTARLAGLNRDLSRLVGERTTQLKMEADQHKGTSARLAEALERFEQVINNITEVFWLTDVAKREMVYISSAYQRVWGRKCEELYREPHSWGAALHPDDRDLIQRRAATEQAKGGYDVEYRILRPDGAMRWIRGRAFPVRNQQGEVYRIAGIAEDITERKRTLEVLQTQAAILENMAEGVVVTDERGLIVQINPAGERIWGYPREEVLGQTANVFSALPEPEAADQLREVLAGLKATGNWSGTFKNRRKDGTIIFCEAVINRLEIQGRTLMVAVEQDVTERLRAEEQLQMHARVLESMAEAVTVVDEDGAIALTNPAADALLGYGRGELLGKSLLQVAGHSPEEYRREFRRHMEEIKARGSSAGESLARRKDGSVIEVALRNSGLAIGNRLFLVVVGQDITERKRTEQALRQSEETLRVILNATPTPAFLLDKQGTLLAGNQALFLGLGLPAGEVVGQPIFGLLPPDVASRRKAAFDQVIRSREPVQHEDARAGRYYINFYSPVLDAAGNVSRVALLALDITERKRGEAELAKQKEFYHSLFELSPDSILLEDLDGNILDANEAFGRWSGYTRAELLGQNIQRFVPPEGRSELAAHLAVLRSGRGMEHEVWNIRKNGERCLIWLHEKPLALPDGRPGILVVARDLTATRRMERAKEALLGLGTQLAAASSPIEAARAVFGSADRLWKWDAALLDLYSPERNWVEPVLACDVVEGQRREVEPVCPPGVPSASFSRVLREGAQLILRQPGDEATTEFARFGDTSRPAASLMLAPLRLEGRPIGVLSIQSYTPNAFTEGDLQTLQALADHCSSALERIRAGQALQQRETFNRTILATAMDGFFALDFGIDPGGAILDANDAYGRLIGYSREELLHMRIADVEALETPEDLAQHKARIMATGADRFETRHRRKDGRIIDVEICVSRLGGEGERVFGFLRDITERKRADLMKEAFLALGAKLSAARNSVEAARAIYASADRLWQWDAATLSLYSQETDLMESVLFCDVIDGQRCEVVAPPPADSPTPPARRIMRQGAELILREENDQQETEFQRFGDVARASASLMGVAVRREGQIIGVLTIQSYTPRAYTQDDLRTLQALADHCAGALERVRAEAALQESEDQLRAFYDSPGGLRGIVEPQEDDMLVVSSNAPLALAFGRTVEGMHQVRATELGIPRPILDAWLAKLRESQQKDAPVTVEYSTAFRLPGSWALATISPLHAPPGGRPRFAFLAVDISERKRAETILREEHDVLERRVRERTAELQAANDALREAHDKLEHRVQARTAQLRAANAALAESEERYRSLVNNVNVGVYRSAPSIEAPFIQVNPAMARIHGYDSVEEFLKARRADLYQDPRERRTFLAELKRQGAMRNYEMRRKRKDGTPIYCSVSATAHCAPGGEVDWIDGVLEDITERKKAEQSLAEALDLNQKMIAASTMGIAAYRASGECVFANEALARIVGGSLQEVREGNFRRLQAWRECGLLQLAEHALSQGKARAGEVYTTTRFGRSIWMDSHLAPFFSNGQPHLLLMVLDITERKQAEEALRESEARIRAIITGAPVLLFAVDREGIIRFEDGQAFKALGIPPGTTVGKPVNQVYANIPAILGNSRRALQGETFDSVIEVGSVVFNCCYSPSRDKDGRLTGYVGVATNITERHSLERQLLEISDREQARIGQDIHDGLCQHLVSLAFDANWLRNALSSKGRPEATKARRIADCLDQAITEARQLARGLFPVRLETEGLAPALEELANATAARFKLHCRFDSKGTVSVKNAAVATHLYRIAQEAVANAVKHSGARNLSIQLRARARTLELTIEDDGSGLPSRTSRKSAGMGLHIMDYRARSIGGSLQLGAAPAGGTVVCCCVPRGLS